MSTDAKQKARPTSGSWMIAAFLAGCWMAGVSTVRAGVFVVGPSKKVLRTEGYSRSAAFDANSHTVRLFGARNEFVSFQIVFAGSMKDVTVGDLTLTGPGGKIEGVEFFREHYVASPVVSRYSANNVLWDCAQFDEEARKIDAPREFPVQMVPIKAPKLGQPFDVAPKLDEVVWADVFIPEGTAPGVYTGAFMAGGQSMRVNLKVWNFSLPSVSHFPQWAMISPEWVATAFGRPQSDVGQMSKTVDEYFQISHDHRMVLMEDWYGDKDSLEAKGYWGYLTGDGFKGKFGAGVGFELIPVDSDAAGGLVADIEKQGWLNRAFAMTGDEPGDEDAYREVIKSGEAAKAATGGKMRTWITKLYDLPNPSWPSLDRAIDIFCSAATPPAEIPRLDAKGKNVWTYNAGYAGACATDAPGVASRTNAWAGYVTGARAWYFWDAVYVVDRQMKFNQRYKGNGKPWKDDPQPYLTDVWNNTLTLDESLKPTKNGFYGEADAIRINGDGNLIYAGDRAGLDGPVVDFRMKNIRLGSQDFEYLYLLDKLGKGALARKEAEGLLGPVKRLGGPSGDGQAGEMKFAYDTDGEKWDAARIRMGDALDKIGDSAIRAKVKPWNQFPNPVGQPNYIGGQRF